MGLIKTQASFKTRAYIKDHVNRNISGSRTYNELCQIHRKSAVFYTVVLR